MRHNHQRHRVLLLTIKRFVLNDRRDADLLLGQLMGDLCQNAGLIFDEDPEIEAAANGRRGA